MISFRHFEAIAPVLAFRAILGLLRWTLEQKHVTIEKRRSDEQSN